MTRRIFPGTMGQVPRRRHRLRASSGPPPMGSGLGGLQGPSWSEGPGRAALGRSHSWSPSSSGGVASDSPRPPVLPSLDSSWRSPIERGGGDAQVHCLFPACSTVAERSPGPPTQAASNLAGLRGLWPEAGEQGGPGHSSSSVKTLALSGPGALCSH